VRGARRRCGAVAAALLVAAIAGSPAGVAAQEQPAPTPAAPGIALVERPAWARPTDQLTFALAATGDPATTFVQVEVFSALDSVAELVESESEDVGVRLSRTPPTPVTALVPGPDGTRLVGLSVAPEPVDDQTTQLVEPGVHPVVISLLGPGGEVLDEVRTPLVRLGDEEDPWEAADLAVLLDVAAPPSLRPDGTRDLSADDLAPLARVGRLLADHPDADLTVAAVPDTLDALATLPDPEASALLEQLVGREVLAAPYVRLPVAGLVEHGLEGLVAPLVERGTALLTDRLQTRPRGGVWDGELPPGAGGARLVDDLGYGHVVVPATAAEDEDADEDDGEDPVPLLDPGPRPVAEVGPLEALVADADLSAELARSLPDRVDAAHVALARHLLRPTEADPPTTVLVRPGALAARSALAGLVDLLDDPAAPVHVGGLGLLDDTDPDDTDPDEVDAAAHGAPDPAWPGGDDPGLAAVAPRVLAVAGQLDSFAALLGPGSPRADDVRLQVATAVAADTSSDGRAAAMGAAEAAVGGAFDAVTLTGQTDLNLTSRRGTLPVTVANANPFPVDVLVRVRSDRLRFPDGGALTLTVDPADARRIDVPVEARATGSVPVFVELWTPDDRIQLDQRRLNVRSTAFSGVGLVLSLGAVLVLLGWWVRHIRSTRRARAAASGIDPTSME